VIDIPLQKNVQQVKLEARQKESLKAWDKRRKEAGVGEKAGLWDVLYASNSTNNLSGGHIEHFPSCYSTFYFI